MPLWRCPHCGTPQAETSRCWVCHRSTTSCATCRHFRRGVASGLGLCGLDPHRLALRGTEMRACWASADPVDDQGPQRVAVTPAVAGPSRDPDGRRTRTFVPVDELERPREPKGATAPALAAVPDPERGGWSLWGDLEA